MAVYQSETGKWYLSLMIRGRRYHQAIPEATDKRGAEKAETVFKSELLQGRYNLATNKGEILFKKLADEYIEYVKTNNLSQKSILSRLKVIIEFFGNKKLNEISPIMIERYRTERKRHKKPTGETLSNTSINREVEILRKMFSIAIDNGWIDESPCSSRKVRKLRVDTKKERFLTYAEEDRLLLACTDHLAYLKPIVLCALNTGMRKSEILKLKWDYVDLKKGFITVTKTKSGKDRKIPINSVLLKELKCIHNNKISEYVFTNPQTCMPFYDIKKGFPAICKKAGVTNFVFHDLRHTAATRMVAAGIDLIVVQDILGHASITTTMRYSHPVPERKLDAVEALAMKPKETNLKLV